MYGTHDTQWKLESASGCTGSDTGFVCLEFCVWFISRLLGLPIIVSHTFCCEKDVAKRTLLKSLFSPLRLFGDVADLGRRMATD